MSILGRMRQDVDAALERDPAARSRAEVALLYPGVHALWAHRLSHKLWALGAKFPARALSQTSRVLTNIEIHPGAELGDRIFIDHGAGVVIGETAEVGDDVTIFHGVTLGGTSMGPGRRHPSIGDRTLLGAGAKVLGPITVGEDSRVGANAVLVKSVDAGSTVVGVPGQVVAATAAQASVGHRAETSDADQPDPLAFVVRSLLKRVGELESRLAALGGSVESDSGHDLGPASADPPALYREDGVWQLEDYAI